MTKTIKVSLTLFAAALFMGIFALSASAAQSGTSGATTFSVSGGVLTVSGSGAMADYTGEAQTPWYGETFTSVVISEGVTGVGNYCFANKTAVTSVSLPSTLRSIGNYAFLKTGISTITIPTSLLDMGYGAFSNCSNLSTVYYNAKNCESSSGSSSIVTFGSSVKNIYFGSEVQIIPDNMFLLTKITSVNIPDNIKKIGDAAFYNCTSLTTVNISSSSRLYYIGTKAFSKCTALSSIYMPSLMTYIGDEAFYNCSALNTTFNLSYHLTGIGGDAFTGSGIKVQTTTDAYAYSYCQIYGIECTASGASYGNITAEPVEVYVNTDTALTVLNGKLDIYVEFDKPLTNECVHVAFYNSNNVVVDYLIVPIIRDNTMNKDIVVNDVSSAAYAKIFVWDSLDTLRPVSPIERVEIIRP